ncbi:hypothetical protein [Nannocystis pusilla]|uniref:Lipoprotein n=1 Tax=Nannocystis pusilla TaxID=889268 RepID=A0ABS7TR75_9BACT|nr:hypothetical protein [Nannocystis pusilla]MBZ5710681.1 hypothetical protein [Nannocystis pusilla]
MTAHDPTRTPHIRRCHHWRPGQAPGPAPTGRQGARTAHIGRQASEGRHAAIAALVLLLAAACTRQPEQPKAQPAPVDTRTKGPPPAGPQEATPPPVSGAANPGAAAAPEPGTEPPGGDVGKKTPTRADEHK